MWSRKETISVGAWTTKHASPHIAVHRQEKPLSIMPLLTLQTSHVATRECGARMRTPRAIEKNRRVQKNNNEERGEARA